MLSYVFKTGFRNLGARKLFTFASIATIACSVFIYCVLFISARNISSLIHKVETTVGIQVFFNEDLSEDEIVSLAEKNFNTQEVKSMRFKSSAEAWEKFKIDYFDNKEELALAFEDDNPLIHSASYEILLNDITKQIEYVNYISNIDGVRQVNYSNVLIETLTKLNNGIRLLCILLISLFSIIAIILISNTISLASEFRKKENEIMKLIGATNFMIRAPFVIEGFLIGVFGSVIPICFVILSYHYLLNVYYTKVTFITNIFEPISIKDMFIPLVVVSFTFSSLVSMIVSFFTIRNHLKV